MTNGLTLLIFDKALKYPSISEKEFSEADIVNYSQVDAERMSSGGTELATMITAIPQVAVGVILMYHYTGVAFLAGTGVLILTTTLTYISSKRSYRFNKEILKKKDERMRVTQ